MIKYIYKGLPFKPNSGGCFGIGSVLWINLDNKSILFDVGGYGARKLIKDLVYSKCIDMVVISHLHFDHCTNLDLFIDTNIPIYISGLEIEEYFKNRDTDIDLYYPFSNIINDINLVKVEKEIYLTKDVKIIFTPGHTLGHISLEVFDEDLCVLAGDSIKTINDYNDCNNYGNAIDSTLYIETKKKLISKYSHIYFGHDGEICNGIFKNRGEFYEF